MNERPFDKLRVNESMNDGAKTKRPYAPKRAI